MGPHLTQDEINKYRKKVATTTISVHLDEGLFEKDDYGIENHIAEAERIATKYGIDLSKGELGKKYQTAKEKAVNDEIKVAEEDINEMEGISEFELALEHMGKAIDLGKKYEIPVNEQKFEEMKKSAVNILVSLMENEIRKEADADNALIGPFESDIRDWEKIMKEYSEYID
jgi:hypothetical protein